MEQMLCLPKRWVELICAVMIDFVSVLRQKMNFVGRCSKLVQMLVLILILLIVLLL